MSVCEQAKARIANLSDLDDLLRLMVSFGQVLGRNQPDIESLRKGLKCLLGSGNAEFVIVTDDKAVAVGYVQQRYRYSLWLNGLEAALEDLFVSPANRRQGIGTRLVQFAIDRAREKGCRAIKLDTNERNDEAIQLYRKLGFSSGSSRFPGAQQLSMEKTLG